MSRPIVIATLLFTLLAAPLGASAAPALPPDRVRNLEAMQQRLTNGEQSAVAEQAWQAANRLEGGNSADRWARALYLQLAANAEMHRGDNGRAADLLAMAAEIDQVDTALRLQWLHQEARLRLNAGQLQRGTELLASWLNQDRGSTDDRWLLVQLLADQQRWDEAARWADRARDITPAMSRERMNLAGVIYQRAGRHETALELLNQHLAVEGKDPDSWRRAAGLAQRLEQPGRAVAIWETAWRLGVLNSADDLRRLVLLHLSAGTPARAAEYLAAALQEGRLPDNLKNRRLLAEAWSAARAQREALQAWRHVAERSGRAEDWRRLGELAYGWGDWQQTIEALRQARGTGEVEPRDWLLAGVACMALDQTQAARRAFEAARRAGSTEADAWLLAIDAATRNAASDEERHAS